MITQASLLKVPKDIEPLKALQALKLTEYKAAIFMHSGAADMKEEHLDKLRPTFEMMARFADDFNVLIADGGTNAGGMRLIGEARLAVKASFPLIGCGCDQKSALIRVVNLQSGGELYPLNSGHSHFLLVEAEDFGAESDLLVGIGATLKKCQSWPWW